VAVSPLNVADLTNYGCAYLPEATFIGIHLFDVISMAAIAALETHGVEDLPRSTHSHSFRAIYPNSGIISDVSEALLSVLDLLLYANIASYFLASRVCSYIPISDDDAQIMAYFQFRTH
jgi:hypothetical protein